MAGKELRSVQLGVEAGEHHTLQDSLFPPYRRGRFRSPMGAAAGSVRKVGGYPLDRVSWKQPGRASSFTGADSGSERQGSLPDFVKTGESERVWRREGR